LRDWSQWPGAQHPSARLQAENEFWRQEIDQAIELSGRIVVREIWESTHRSVVLAARTGLPGGRAEPGGPEAMAVAQAAFVGAAIACCLEFDWSVPPDLQEQWAWFTAGHWPCAYAVNDWPARPPLLLLVV
jgi:hypothetical protein